MSIPSRSLYRAALISLSLMLAGAAPALAADRDNNSPGPRGGPGTNWENPPGPRGGPGASPDRRRDAVGPQARTDRFDRSRNDDRRDNRDWNRGRNEWSRSDWNDRGRNDRNWNERDRNDRGRDYDRFDRGRDHDRRASHDGNRDRFDRADNPPGPRGGPGASPDRRRSTEDRTAAWQRQVHNNQLSGPRMAARQYDRGPWWLGR